MGWFRAIRKWFTANAVNDASMAADLAKKAIPIVRIVARLTPTRVDDEIVRLFETFGIPKIDAWLELPIESRGRALFHAAAHELKRWAPGTVDRVIDLAVQMAVVEVKAAEQD